MEKFCSFFLFGERRQFDAYANTPIKQRLKIWEFMAEPPQSYAQKRGIPLSKWKMCLRLFRSTNYASDQLKRVAQIAILRNQWLSKQTSSQCLVC